MDSITLRRTEVKTPSVHGIGSLEVTKVPLSRRKARLKAAEVRRVKKVKGKAVAASRKVEASRDRGEAKVASKEAGEISKMANKLAGSRLNKTIMVLIGTNGIPPTNGQLAIKHISNGIPGSS